MYPELLLKNLRPFKNKRDILIHHQDVGDIITGILLTHEKYATEYDKIVGYFLGNTAEATAKNVWHFVKNHVKYKVEPEHEQLLKSPAAIITPATINGKRNTSDCKNKLCDTENHVCIPCLENGDCKTVLISRCMKNIFKNLKVTFPSDSP